MPQLAVCDGIIEYDSSFPELAPTCNGVWETVDWVPNSVFDEEAYSDLTAAIFLFFMLAYGIKVLRNVLTAAPSRN